MMARTIDQQWRPMWIVFGMLCFFVAVEAGIAVWLGTQPPPTQQGIDPTIMLGTLGAVAALELFVVIPLMMRKKLPPRDRVGNGRTIDLSQPPDETVAPLLGRLRQAMIFAWAMGHSIAIYGLIAAFLYHRVEYFAPFGAAAATAFVWFAPRRSLLESVLRAARS